MLMQEPILFKGKEVGDNLISLNKFEEGYFNTLISLGVADSEEIEENNDIMFFLSPRNIHPKSVFALLPGVNDFLSQHFIKSDAFIDDDASLYNAGVAFALDRHGYSEGFPDDSPLKKISENYSVNSTATLSEGIDGKYWVFIE